MIFHDRDEYQGKRPPRGVLKGRSTQIAPQESVDEHIRGSVERLDNQVMTLHQDVATLSYEVTCGFFDVDRLCRLFVFTFNYLSCALSVFFFFR